MTNRYRNREPGPRSRRLLHLIAFALVLGLAVLCLVVGAGRLHTVYPQGTSPDAAAATPTMVTDRELIIDATFSGVKKEGQRLISTYAREADSEQAGTDDAATDDGKRACPT